MSDHYTRSSGQRVHVSSVNIFQLRNAAKAHHAADPAHADLAGMIAEISRRDAVYYAEHSEDTRPTYPWDVQG